MISNTSGVVGYLRIVQILDSLPALVGYVDLDLRIIYANKLIEAWYQRPLSELIGMQLENPVFGGTLSNRRDPPPASTRWH